MRAIRIGGMRRVLAGLATAAACSMTWSSVADGTAGAHGPDGLVIRTVPGRSVDRATMPEPAGVIREFRVAAPAGTRMTVTVVIPGLAGVSASIPRARFDNAETCSRSRGYIRCAQAEEACPMPAADWRVRLRKISGPAGPVRIDFVVGSRRAR